MPLKKMIWTPFKRKIQRLLRVVLLIVELKSELKFFKRE